MTPGLSKREEHEQIDYGRPLDLTFKDILSLKDVSLDMKLRSTRVNGVPNRGADGRYKSRSIWISNNLIENTAGLQSAVDKLLIEPCRLGWLDLSFNMITEISEEIARFRNLRILYLHANYIKDLATVNKIRNLPLLRSLTLHGNPIEYKIPQYRLRVIRMLPQILSLDFSGILPSERERPAPPRLKVLTVD